MLLLAGDAAAARRRSAEFDEPIHLLLTDIVMPHTSGFRLPAPSPGRAPALHVLDMSGYTDSHMNGTQTPGEDVPLPAEALHHRRLLSRLRQALQSDRQAQTEPPA